VADDTTADLGDTSDANETKPLPGTLRQAQGTGDSNETKPMPGTLRQAQGTDSHETVEYVTVAPPTKKRHRGRNILIGSLVIVVILVVVAAIVGDSIARQVATAYARDQITKALDLPSSKPVHVDLGGGSILLQALSGSLNDATVTVDTISLDGFTGSAKVVAHGIPLDNDKPVKKLDLTVDATAASVEAAVKKGATELNDATVALGTNKVTIGASLPLLGQTVPFKVSLKPGASKGDLTFTALDFTIAGKTFSLKDLEGLLPSGALSGATGPQSICIADKLPKSLVLTGVNVTSKRLEMRINGDGAVLNAKALETKGSC
jgi:hypothetical protein